MKTSECIVCCQAKTTKGMLRGVCEKCQIDVFVSAHMDKISLEYSKRFDAREERLCERELAVEENEKGIELIRLIKEII